MIRPLIFKLVLLFVGCLVCAQLLLLFAFTRGSLSPRGLVVAVVLVALGGLLGCVFALPLFLSKRSAQSSDDLGAGAQREPRVGASQSPQSFDTVWYRPTKNGWSDLNLLAYTDVGRLAIHQRSIEFQGSKERLTIENVRRVSYGKQGRDFVNNWVKVEYGDGPKPSTAFFADGTERGWGGIFGGTKRIFAATKHLAP